MKPMVASPCSLSSLFFNQRLASAAARRPFALGGRCQFASGAPRATLSKCPVFRPQSGVAVSPRVRMDHTRPRRGASASSEDFNDAGISAVSPCTEASCPIGGIPQFRDFIGSPWSPAYAVKGYSPRSFPRRLAPCRAALPWRYKRPCPPPPRAKRTVRAA